MRRVIATFAAMLWPAAAFAQLPDVDIHVATFAQSNGRITIGQPVNATARPGYDNQPWFADDGSWFLYASIDSSGQSDVYRWRDGAGIERVTNTPESEYSPTVLPGGTGFSTVRVEMDGTQRLWRFDADGGNPTLLLSGVDSVGYHAWVDEGRLALFIVGEPHTLRLVDLADERERAVAVDIGRSVTVIPTSGEVCFAKRVSGEVFRFFAFQPDGGAIREVGPLLDDGQDCAWTPAGTLLMASRRTLFRFDPTGGGHWTKIRSFEGKDLARITRIAVSPAGNRIALVAARQAGGSQ